MPPRLPSAPVSLVSFDAALMRCSVTQAAPVCRAFSTTPSLDKMSKGRVKMFEWLESRAGTSLAEAPNSPNYLGPYQDQPFPLNPLFRSQPVLDDTTKELIYDKVVSRGESLKAVSAEMHVDVRRVAAVVRLKEVEKQWTAEGKKLATPYAKAVMKMLPKTSYREGEENVPHEPINEIHVHNLTMQQLFVPVSESRRFTREDAAKAFHETMLSADQRSPQRQLIDMEKDVLKGVPRDESMSKFREITQREEDKVAEKLLKARELAEKQTTKHQTERYEFRFKEIQADDVGRNGRSRKGTGWRYGAPLQDRKRGQVKIPTSVP